MVKHDKWYVVTTGDCWEGAWYLLQHMRETLDTAHPRVLLLTCSMEQLARLRVPVELDTGCTNEWTDRCELDGTDESLMELAARTTAHKYVGRRNHPLATWRQHHAWSWLQQDDELLGPNTSYDRDNHEQWAETMWWRVLLHGLCSIVVSLSDVLSTREWVEGSGLTSVQVRVLDELSDVQLVWANDTVDALLLQSNNEAGLEKVGRALQAETSTHGLTFKNNNQRFKTVTEEAQQAGRTASQWSWLRTLIMYKLNAHRQVHGGPQLAVHSTARGGAVTIQAPSAAQETASGSGGAQPCADTVLRKRPREEPGPPPDSSRVAQTFPGRDLPMKAPGPLATQLGASSKAAAKAWTTS
jgi:hypothetical protein